MPKQACISRGIAARTEALSQAISYHETPLPWWLKVWLKALTIQYRNDPIIAFASRFAWKTTCVSSPSRIYYEVAFKLDPCAFTGPVLSTAL